MPQFSAELERIRDLLNRSAGTERSYTPNPCLSEEQVQSWESLSEFSLPEQYRVFLTKIGNGGRMPGSYCDFVLDPLAKVWGRWTAAEPFPVTAERLRDRFLQLYTEGRPADGVLFPELGPFWEEAERPPGCLQFGQYPCSDGLFLVTAGELQGTVWCSVCGGIPEVDESGAPFGFLAWFARTLAELLDETEPTTTPRPNS